jgi:atypical dual specificity phosphatase
VLENFRFVVEGELAGMAHPGYDDGLEESLIELKARGIAAIVSLDEYGLDEAILARYEFAYLHLPIDDFTAPTLRQADQFVEFVREQAASKVGVVAHCYAGIGRTGTMLAVYLVAQGRTAEEAVDEVRRASGRSVETSTQRQLIFDYAARSRQRRDARGK